MALPDLFSAGLILNALGALAILVLGAIVLRARPRSRSSVLFATYAIIAGATAGALNVLYLISPEPGARPIDALRLTLLTISALAPFLLLLFSWSFPRRPTTRIPHRVAVATAATLYAAAIFAGTVGSFGGPEFALSMGPFLAQWWMLGIALLWMAQRYADPDLGPDDRRAIAIVAGALGLYWSVAFGTGLINFTSAGPFPDAFRWSSLARAWSPLLVIAAWLWATATVPPDAKRGARNVALLLEASLAFLIVKELLRLNFLGEIGISRMIMVLLIGYAVLRHQLLGLDVQVRWTISKSTVAAVFIAVFFIASEAAQQFFGDRFESGYLGILAAGALVFAIAPLSRVADRLAEKAVPLAAAPVAAASAGAVEGRRAVFADAVRRSLRDGAVTREEETYLARLATELGLDYATALGIRHDIEAKRTAGGQ